MANEKKYANLSTLRTFLDNLKTIFATMSHKHTIEDISDYTVDSQLSSQSTNPVQNKVIDAEFNTISDAIDALETVVDSKSDSNHNHNEYYYTKEEVDSITPAALTTDEIDEICGAAIEYAEEVMF